MNTAAATGVRWNKRKATSLTIDKPKTITFMPGKLMDTCAYVYNECTSETSLGHVN